MSCSVRKVLTVGTFDLFHTGHVELLRRCAELGEVTVGLNYDDFIFRFKGHYPACTFEERKEMLESCRYVHEVLPNYGNEDSKQLILKVKPYYLVVGSDWARKDYYKQMDFTQDWLDAQNITLIYAVNPNIVSTTKIKERVKTRC